MTHTLVSRALMALGLSNNLVSGRLVYVGYVGPFVTQKQLMITQNTNGQNLQFTFFRNTHLIPVHPMSRAHKERAARVRV